MALKVASSRLNLQIVKFVAEWAQKKQQKIESRQVLIFFLDNVVEVLKGAIFHDDPVMNGSSRK